MAGSNIDPENNLLLAFGILDGQFGIVKTSDVFASPPADGRDDMAYLNCIFVLETELDKAELKTRLRMVEDVLGRQRTKDKFAARAIDLDIVYDGTETDEDIGTRLYAAKCFLQTAGDVTLADGMKVSETISKLESEGQTAEPVAGLSKRIKRGYK
jgi:2-amino-4-hydroxy-6-hydroxymethyldihydropteridine diphosphokinase